MKMIAVIVAFVIAGFVAYQYLGPGSSGSSSTVQQLDELERRFDVAKKRLGSAGRGAAVAGIDTTSDVDAARTEIDAILGEIGKLRREATESERSRLERLESAVRAYRQQLS